MQPVKNTYKTEWIAFLSFVYFPLLSIEEEKGKILLEEGVSFGPTN